MFQFHHDRKRYFDIQYQVATHKIIPIIEKFFNFNNNIRVLEVGCGEGGILKAFAEKDCICVGVDNDDSRIKNGLEWLEPEVSSGRITLISKDIFHLSPNELGGGFDLIVLKDVIEHILNKEQLLSLLSLLLKPGGKIFFGFPPWQMPFGGHQQMCRSRVLSKIPYLHLLPRRLYRSILKAKKEPWEALLEIREARISIEGFERTVKRSALSIVYNEHYLINPIYTYKFGLRSYKQSSIVKQIPYFRNFFTTCVYYIVEKGKKAL